MALVDCPLKKLTFLVASLTHLHESVPRDRSLLAARNHPQTGLEPPFRQCRRIYATPTYTYII